KINFKKTYNQTNSNINQYNSKKKNLHQYLNFNSNINLIHTPYSKKYLQKKKQNLYLKKYINKKQINKTFQQNNTFSTLSK
ncbi:DUF825 domain-containing protein, partial [Pseudomonas syringae pv. maculicola]|nr:DUF825 domain-containing protein [Pseudomonas syringae pv. maculicola]